MTSEWELTEEEIDSFLIDYDNIDTESLVKYAQRKLIQWLEDVGTVDTIYGASHPIFELHLEEWQQLKREVGVE